MDVNSLGTGVAGSIGNKLIASGSSQSYTATLSTSTLGTQVEAFSLNVADDHTLAGASSATNVSTSATLTVLGHTAPILAVASGNNQTVIVGATGISAGLNLTNGSSGQSGLASLDVNSLGAGVAGSIGNKLVASGSSQSYTATLSTSTLGTQVRAVFAECCRRPYAAGGVVGNECFDQCNADGSRPHRPNSLRRQRQ